MPILLIMVGLPTLLKIIKVLTEHRRSMAELQMQWNHNNHALQNKIESMDQEIWELRERINQILLKVDDLRALNKSHYKD